MANFNFYLVGYAEHDLTGFIGIQTFVWRLLARMPLEKYIEEIQRRVIAMIKMFLISIIIKIR